MNSSSNRCYPAQSYDTYSAAWQRFATLLGNGAKAVREVCPDAKIVLHSELPPLNSCNRLWSISVNVCMRY